MSRTTLLAGGVGGARLARGLAAVVPSEHLTVIVNVGDDDRIYGAHVAADLDTVTYTLAGVEGPHGWGVAGDTFEVMAAFDTLGADTSFRLGDRDLALCLRRTEMLDDGVPLSTVTGHVCTALGVAPTVLPATDDELRTRINTREAGWLAFQDYFVRRGHSDEVIGLWQGENGRAADVTLVWGRSMVRDAYAATAELDGTTVDQDPLFSGRFTLIAPDALKNFGDDAYLEIHIWNSRGKPLGSESLYDIDVPEPEPEDQTD